ncbi:MAG: HAD family hydrolase [Chloroflexota bacterium]
MSKNGSTSKYTHLIWDWNGTIQDDAWLCIDVINGLLQKRRKPAITLQRYQEIFGFPVKGYYQKVGFDFSIEPYESLAAKYVLEYDNRSRECNLQPQAVDMLNLWTEKNLSQYILSASQQGPLEINIAHYGLKKYFHRIVGLSDYYANGKIDSGRKLVSELDVSADSILLIGDTIHDYEVAQSIGIDCVLFSGGHQSKERLDQCGTPVVENLVDLLAVVG